MYIFSWILDFFRELCLHKCCFLFSFEIFSCTVLGQGNKMAQLLEIFFTTFPVWWQWPTLWQRRLHIIIFVFVFLFVFVFEIVLSCKKKSTCTVTITGDVLRLVHGILRLSLPMLPYFTSIGSSRKAWQAKKGSEKPSNFWKIALMHQRYARGKPGKQEKDQRRIKLLKNCTNASGRSLRSISRISLLRAPTRCLCLCHCLCLRIHYYTYQFIWPKFEMDE